MFCMHTHTLQRFTLWCTPLFVFDRLLWILFLTTNGVSFSICSIQAQCATHKSLAQLILSWMLPHWFSILIYTICRCCNGHLTFVPFQNNWYRAISKHSNVWALCTGVCLRVIFCFAINSIEMFRLHIEIA